MTPRTDIGFILHFPLTAAIKGEDVDWELIPVDLTVGRQLADDLTALRNATGTDAFGPAIQLVAPAPSLAVEHDTEGDGPPTAAPSVARTKYRDMAATEVQVEDVAYLNAHPDEGDTVTADVVAALGERYKNLPDVKRSWVTVTGAKVRINPRTGGVASERRRLLLTSLIDLSADFDDDDIVRAIAHRILGDVAHFANVAVADLVGALGIDEARRFAAISRALVAGNASLRYDLERRAYIEPSVAA